LRRYVAAALAVPVLAQIYLPLILRRSVFARTSLAVVMGAVLGLAVVVYSRPAGTVATPPQQSVPLTSAEFRTALRTDVNPDAAVTVAFSTPMDRRSVEASLRVDPATPVRVSWDTAGTTLTVRPEGSWATGTHHTVTIEAGALAATGRPLSSPVRAAFLTRQPTVASISAIERHGERALPTTAILLEFAHPVDLASLRSALRIRPAVTGTIEPLGSARSGNRYVFRPATPLAPNTAYRIRLAGVVDASGASVAETPTVVVRTAAPPSVVRFRPGHQTKAVERTVLLSVRFTEPMQQRSTKAAFRVTVDGRAVKGTVAFAENRTVLVFRPARALPYGKKVTMTVAGTARSVAGLPLGKTASAKIAIMRRPVLPPTGGGSGSTPPPPSGGGAGGGSWRAVEEYYLGLMNCTRTGGWVTSSGRCDSPGGRDVAPLWIHSGISSEVSRPYARLLASRGACDHFIGGTPGDRLRRAGYTSYIWAENLGCRSGNPYTAVLGSHRFFQDEKYDSDPTDHYTNLMNPDYDRVGLGVWVAHGNVRLVVNFYHPR
jgi:Bacterial Ig-like domain